jgi:DNA-binding GntR family transcriptional regulator
MAVPSYQRLATSLLSQLRSGNFTYGDFIPPKDLKTATSIPLITVIDNIYFFPLS